MGKTYDIESVLLDIQSFLQANLPAKLSALDTEKNDGISLAVPPSAAYFMQTLDDSVVNYAASVVYGVEDFEAPESLGPATAQRVSFCVAVLISTGNNDLPTVLPRRLFRYQRALRELFEKNWASVGGNVKFRVTGLKPAPIAVTESRIDHIIGISLGAALP